MYSLIVHGGSKFWNPYRSYCTIAYNQWSTMPQQRFGTKHKDIEHIRIDPSVWNGTLVWVHKRSTPLLCWPIELHNLCRLYKRHHWLTHDGCVNDAFATVWESNLIWGKGCVSYYWRYICFIPSSQLFDLYRVPHLYTPDTYWAYTETICISACLIYAWHIVTCIRIHLIHYFSL